ncbi:pyridoxal-dependent aspartate 1-decarboxylase PanP [Microcoleus sp. D3_18_C4]|uniref:pyridoxal-dependent aspartate 1-decarboxylase PanP n=1 Tax=Microcoleus sp. D3_18_C4 TaxID=3055335 RepID=UPI002FCED23B
MSKLTVQAKDCQDVMQPLKACVTPLEKKLMELFSASEKSFLAEEAMEERISGLVQDFLYAKTASTDIDLELIIQEFRENKIPALPTDVGNYIDDLTQTLVAHSIHTSSPRYIGHMTSALPYFVRPIAKLLTAMNQNLVKMETAKVLSPCERQTLAMMHRLIYDFSEDFYNQHIQKSDSTLGIMTTGGTLANITALWCARNASLGPKNNFSGIEKEGLYAALEFYGYKGMVIIGSNLMHYSFEKAAGLLGIGDRNLLKIPTDCNHRMDLAALRQTVAECRDRNLHILAIIGIGGSTDSGSIDPLPEIAAIAQEANAHFHVDAAWGGPVLFSERHRHKFAGIELADSVTIDGHKQMYLPMGIGLVLFRNPQTAKVIEKHAPYTVRKDSIDLGKRSLEGSRPGASLYLQAALNIIGHQGYEFLIDGGIHKTQHLANLIRENPAFELLLEPEINILLYRYIPETFREKAAKQQLTEADNHFINQFNERLQEAQRQAGHTFVSRTTLQNTCYGKTIPIVAFRVVLANPLTTEADINIVLNDQLKIAAKLSLTITNSDHCEEVNHHVY